MRNRILAVLGFGLLAVALVAGPAAAGSPHFIQSAFTTSTSGATLTVSGKVAGLGDEAQIHVVLTATAQCVNPGGHDPQAGNKQSVSAEGDFPVQNGKALFSLTAVATLQPPCSPPMTIKWSDVVVTADGLTANL
jgi:hypothetical protein